MPHPPPTDARATIQAWVAAFNQRDLDALCTLYAPDAVLWGTLATELITQPAALRAYFERALGPALDTRVELLDAHEQAEGPLAVVSGRYRLRFREGGAPREALARYSFVLARAGAGWAIRHHHSSLMPEAPALATGAAASPAAQALRLVSILFMDVVGSTTLAQRLDPESVAQVMDGALVRGTAIVRAHGGRVLQYAGDNILAVFGAEAAHEDDAERAVLCGLALRVLGQALGREVAAAHGHEGFGVRVGIHTGGVLLGGGVDAEGSIRGVAVNIAARMEQTAPPGGLRVSQDTWLQVRGLFDAEPQPPLAVKGVDEPVTSWLVTGPKPRHQRTGPRGLEGVPTRMVGRAAELARLQAAFGRLAAGPRLAVLNVEAEAGVGKSRLRQEFEAWAEAQPLRSLMFRGRATPATAAQPYGLLRDIVATRLHIADDDTLEAARRKLEAALVPLFVHDDGPELAEAHAHLLGHLVGIDARASRHLRGILDDPRQIRSRAFHAAAQWLRRLGAQQGQPLLLLLEDLHWADAESLEFLQHLVATGADLPLLVLAFTRPPPEGALPWAAAAPAHERLVLHPLGAGDSAALADELLQKLPDAPAALRGLLTHKAEGNPFYMEELLRMLIAQGAVLPGEPWRVDAERLRITRVPPTLAGVLQARLDGLAPPLRQALQQASIVGAVFWDRALAAVDEQAPGQLPALVQRELTLPRGDAPLEGLHEYAFRHQLLHQVTYDTVLRAPRQQGHARVARWLAALSDQGGLHAGDLLGLAAEHFERAGLAAPAAEYHARAAEHAGERVAHARVLAHVARALALLGDATEAAAAGPAALRLRWRLRAVREHTLHLQSRRDEQGAELDAMDRLAEALDDDALRADAARRRSLRAMRMADWPAMEQAGRRGADAAARAGAAGLRLQALRLVALALVHQGRYDDGRALVAQALPEVRRRGLREVEARLLNVLAIAAEAQGGLVEAQALDRQSLQAFAEVGDRVNEAISLANVGEGAMKLGALEAGERDLLAALQRVRANGDTVFEALVLGQLSTLARWRGDAAAAQQRAAAALAIARQAQAPDTELVARLRVADAALALGQPAAAHEAYTQALALAQSLDHGMAHDATAGLARAALARGAVADALAAAQPLLARGEAGGGLDGAEYPRAIEWTLAELLQAAGDTRAEAWLSRAHAALAQQAAAIGDAALREAFLRDIPHHRAIVAAAAARGGAG